MRVGSVIIRMYFCVYFKILLNIFCYLKVFCNLQEIGLREHFLEVGHTKEEEDELLAANLVFFDIYCFRALVCIICHQWLEGLVVVR